MIERIKELKELESKRIMGSCIKSECYCNKHYCNNCGLFFAYISEKSIHHFKQCNKILPYHCDECGNKFSNDRQLQNHKCKPKKKYIQWKRKKH
jgi:hypothetical protein